MSTTTLNEAVHRALETVFDPEYPGVSIVELGLVEEVEVDGMGSATVGLVPTFAGCPALDFIAADVDRAVRSVDGVTACAVEWLRSPVWSTDRVAPSARRHLEREFTVTFRRADGSLRCPVCGSAAVADTSPAGPTRCRSLAWCPDCRNPVEVMR